MRFESFLWKVLVVFLVGGVGWETAGGVQPLQTDEQFEAADGGSTIPPP